MRSLRVSSVHLFVALGLAALAAGASACSGDKPRSRGGDESNQAIGETGKLGLALTARSSSGSLFRLRQATFDVFRLGDVGSNPGNPGFPTEPFPNQPTPPGFPTPGFPAGVDAGSGFPDDDVVIGAGGSSSSGGGTSSGGFAGSVVIDPPFPQPRPVPTPAPPSGGQFFSTTLFSEDDPLASTLEATIPIGQYQITLFDGWFLEKVIDGEAVRVDARLVGSSFQNFAISANDETVVSYRFETNGEIVEFGQGRLIVQIEVEEVEPLPPNARRGVMETSVDALSGLTLRDALDAALRNSGASASRVTSTDVYHAIIDSYSTAELGRDPDASHCDDEQTDGQPSLNGFPLMCPRLEKEQFANLDLWFPLAMVNRLDLAPADGANCGQQRIIFGNNVPNGASRMFIIIEAMVPNPNPECGVDACRPIAEFWNGLTSVDDPFTRGDLLRDAFLNSGVGQFGPFMNSDHLGPDGGQIRTNNFNDFTWTLREFHMQSAPEVLPTPEPVSESPNGQLWNDQIPLPQGPACRQSFIDAIPALLGDNLGAMSFPVAQECKDAESPNNFSQDYFSNLISGSGQFIDQLDSALVGTGLSAFDIANRARFAGSCMGCHQEASGSSLGGGLSAPFQGDFVHVSEQFTEDCGDGNACFGLSNALKDEFIPHRLAVQARLLASPSMCGGGGGGEGGSAGTGMGGAGGGNTAGAGGGSTGGAGGGNSAGSGGGSMLPPPPVQQPPSTMPPANNPPPVRLESSLTAPRLTLGGQMVVDHGH
jgi:hypothetical protein